MYEDPKMYRSHSNEMLHSTPKDFFLREGERDGSNALDTWFLITMMACTKTYPQVHSSTSRLGISSITYSTWKWNKFNWPFWDREKCRKQLNQSMKKWLFLLPLSVLSCLGLALFWVQLCIGTTHLAFTM